MSVASSKLCPACRAAELRPWLDDLSSPLGALHGISRCPACGFGELAPRPADDELDLLYSDAYYRPVDAGAPGPLAALTRVLIRRNLAGRDRLLGFHAPGRLLDVGCGNGAFLARMGGKGWRVTGTDVSAAAVETARRLVPDVHHGDLAAARFPDAAFDAVTLFHVLEHVPDIDATIAEARRVLKPGGILAIEVPNARSAGHAIAGRSWVGLDVPRHFHHFTPQAMAAVRRRHGLEFVWRRPFTFLGALDILYRSFDAAWRPEGGPWTIFSERQDGAARLVRFAGTVAATLPVIAFEWLRPGRGEVITVVWRKPA